MSSTSIVKTEAAPAPDALRQVVQWIIDGRSSHDIADAIAITWPTKKPKPLIVEALKQLAEDGSPDPQVVRGFAIEGTRQIYAKALEVGDHQTALRALKQLVDLAK